MFKKILKNKNLINLSPYLIVIFFVVAPWFFHSGYLFFVDFIWGPVIHWDLSSQLTVFNVILGFFNLFLPSDLSQKFFITLVLLVVLLGGRKITSVLLPKKPVLIFIVSLFFLFNPFVYDRMGYGQIGVVGAFGFMSIAFGYLLEYLEKKQSKQVFLSGIFSGISILFASHFVFFNTVFYMLFIVIVIIKHEKYPWKKLLRDLIIMLLIIIVLNLNWVIGNFIISSSKTSIIESGITRQDFVAFQTAGKDAWQVLTNVLLMGGFWGKDQYRYIDLMSLVGNWGRSFIILLPIMIWGVISAFRDKKRRAFSIGLIIIALVSVFLALGIRMGISEKITFFLFDHLPFYKGMRETQKWVSVIVVCYGVFLAWGLNGLFSTKIVKKNSILFVTILVAIIIMQAPLMVWGMRGQLRPINYPPDWQEIDQTIKKESNCDKNTLFLPWHAYMSFNWVGNIIVNPAKVYFTCPVISSTNMEWGGIYDNSGRIESALISEWINKRSESELLKNNELNIGYIILAKEIDWQNYDWLINHKQINLELIKETNTLLLYKIINE